MKLSEIICTVPILDVRLCRVLALSDIEVSGISTDSRSTVPGDVFVCIRGTRTDSHDFAADAVTRGAVAVVCEKPIAVDVPTVTVENTRHAAAVMWSRYFGSPQDDLLITAVTGTNGKTSVSHMLHRILSDFGIRCGLIGTVCCLIGDEEVPLYGGSECIGAAATMTTPDPKYLYGALAQMRDNGVTHVVMEASSHALALGKLDPISADIAAFTGLSFEHLDFHGNMENYLYAKSVLFRGAKRCIINTDSEYADRLLRLSGVSGDDCIAVGMSREAKIRASRVRNTPQGVSYRLRGLGKSCRIECPMPGTFGVFNSLIAAAAASVIGVPTSEIAASLSNFPGVPGRMETIFSDGRIRVVRDFAHTPEAMEKAIGIMRGGVTGRLIVLFGCGGDRDRTKRPLMGKIAAEGADVVFVTSDNSRSEDPMRIICDVLDGVGTAPCRAIPDRAEAIRSALAMMKKNDVLLLLGKGHENYIIDRDGTHPFDERAIVSEYMKNGSGEPADNKK